MQGNRNALAGIDILRKVCNHPDLLQRSQWQGSEEYGSPERSGKLTVAIKVCLIKQGKTKFKKHQTAGRELRLLIHAPHPRDFKSW